MQSNRVKETASREVSFVWLLGWILLCYVGRNQGLKAGLKVMQPLRKSERERENSMMS
jgi:hypothetical protein